MSQLVYFENLLHVVIREGEDWGIRVLDLASPPRRLWGDSAKPPVAVRTNVDPVQAEPCPSPATLLSQPLADGDTWSRLTRRSLARFEALFLLAEDPQRRLDARPVVTLAHQVSLVRHIRDNPDLRRVLIGDEVGLGKTVVAGLIIQELLAENPGLRVLYLAPARLVTNVAREFDRLELHFREWKAQGSDARLESDPRIIASIHRAVHPAHEDRIRKVPPWDVIVVDECHHLSDWAEGGGDPVQKYRLVRDLVAAQPPDGRLLLLSGTPHQAHAARFENLIRLLRLPDEPESATAGRVIYRTKEDVRDWDGNPLFPQRQVNPPLVVELDPEHREWLTSIHSFFSPAPEAKSEAARRAAGWKCAQALQWAASSPNAGLGYLTRQAMRAGWEVDDPALREALAAMRPYRSGSPDETIESLFDRLAAEIGRQCTDADVEDIEDEFQSGYGDADHAELADLISQGIRLVQAPKQSKWERLWSEILEPAGDEKVVLFAQPIETVVAVSNWLEKKTGTKPAIIIGGQSEAEREAQVARFRDDSATRFLISSRAGGEGINLQFARRLVHLDVPWNPMDMEQRVGRVHRFGSRETIIVDTVVVQDSRETQAWNVARARLRTVAEELVAPDRFETVFSRVMCLIPPEELQSVLVSAAVTPLADRDVSRLSALVDAGFQDWQSFHARYAANQKLIKEQPAGLARWPHLKDFLVGAGAATLESGIQRTRFVFSDGKVESREGEAEVIRLKDGSVRFVGDFDGGLFSGNLQVGPLGLNIDAVAQVMRDQACPRRPSGAAFVRWGDQHLPLRNAISDGAIILVFLRQRFRLDPVGSANEVGNEIVMYSVTASGTQPLPSEFREMLFYLNGTGTVRMKPPDGADFSWVAAKEQAIANELRRPEEDEFRAGFRYAVWPILALHLSE